MQFIIAAFVSVLTWAFAQAAMAPVVLSGKPAWVWLGVPALVATAMFWYLLFALAEPDSDADS